MPDDLDEQNREGNDKFYKIPSKPLKETKNQLIFTRSQCYDKNTCGADCLIHKKRKRKPKTSNDPEESTDFSLNSLEVSEELNNQLDESTSSSATTVLVGSNSIKPSSSYKKMPKRKQTTKSSSRNYLLSDDEGIDDDQLEPELRETNNVNRINYYETFTNNLTEATRSLTSNQSLRTTTYPILVGLLILILTSIYLWSTSQQNSNFISLDNQTFLNVDKFSRAIDEIRLQSNTRAIELFKELKEVQKQFQQLNGRLDKLETELNEHRKQQNELKDEVQEFNKHKLDQTKLNSQSMNCEIQDIKKLIKQAIDKYDADKTGLVDYASEFAGGEIVSTGCTETYDLKGASYKILGVPIWSPPNIPRFVIQPNTSPGQCWYFRRNKGSLIIKLSRLILPESFSYEHISVLNAPDGNINSAPRLFEVRALDNPNADENWLLGEFEYDKNGDTIQLFKFNKSNKPTEYIEFNILDNHGNDEFTCLYRIRVHGRKIDRDE